MGTDGACGLLFCAAKRSGTFPPNMPAGLRARVSRLGGFTRPFILPISKEASPASILGRIWCDVSSRRCLAEGRQKSVYNLEKILKHAPAPPRSYGQQLELAKVIYEES
jgi:hypothetical protein